MTAGRILSKALAFACGAGVAGLALGVFEVVRAQPQAGQPTINLCFGPQNALRLVEPTVPCRPDERRVQVKQRDPKPKEEPQRDSRVAALKQRLDALEERERRGRLVPTRVVAPFEVIDKNKRRMFRVEEENVTVYNEAGQAVAWIFAHQSGAALQVKTADGAKAATLGALGKQAHLLVQEKEKDRIDLGRRADGQYGLQVFAQTGRVAAYIGQSDKGDGLVFVADKAGRHGAQAFVDDKKGAGYVFVMNETGNTVASLFADSRGAGRLELADAKGDLRTDAGVTDDGRGVVQTGPGFYSSGVGLLGLVPSYILGNR